MLIYHLAVAGIIAIHLAWVTVVLVGGAAAMVGWLRRHPALEAGYLAVVGLTALNRLTGPVCWLTQAELHLRSLAGEPVSQLGFIERVLAAAGVPVYGPVILTAGTVCIAVGLGATLVWHLNGIRPGLLPSFAHTKEHA